ncbi:uncharacterized protein BDCG_02144 [Blastomyces dermatitidis ER-3]|uniref:Uncharacterized protein n=1 Tax=Ajellomyces dermatitidis (strain ER-3 / ATCC MYA-2586) TaxID=559297 RepID=A0ABP2EX36_AJEDR|nr:uncharacterized protein BDCG_02144 [Blastomyces dermatitidis ER-3]EEQ87024.2 hypothetical protein BDCG_02144 [Blastomyces dermatitidis ER-3]
MAAQHSKKTGAGSNPWGEMHLDGKRSPEEHFEQKMEAHELTQLRISHPWQFDGDVDLWEATFGQEETHRSEELENFVPTPIPTPPGSPTTSSTPTPTPMPMPAPATAATDDDTLLLSNRLASPKKFSKRPASPIVSRYGNDTSLWTPFWLRKPTLFGFIILFAVLWIALLVLWLFVVRDNGLEIVPTSNRYVWRFSPVAVMIIVVGLWRQVDCHCKAAYPWHEMRKGLASAGKSMVLDYVSDFQVNSFLKAIKSGHHSIAASALGFVLLKVALVFSTGLFVSAPTTLIDPSYPLSMTTNLDGEDWAAKALASEQEFLRSATANSIYAFFGVSEGGVPDPTGSKDGLVFQTFDLHKNHPATRRVTSMSTDVDVLVPLPSCELSETIVQPTAALNEFSNVTTGGIIHLGIESATCHLGFNNYTKVYVRMKNPRTELCEPRELVAEMQQVNCTKTGGQRPPSVPFDNENGDFRWLFTISDIHYSQTFAPSSTPALNVTNWSRDVKRVTTILCKPQYTIVRGNMTYRNYDSGAPPHIELQSPEERLSITNLERVTSSALNGAILQSLRAGAHVFRPVNPAPETASSNEGVNTLFQLMIKTSKGELTLEKFLDGETMNKAFQRVYTGIATQFAQQNLVIPTSKDSTGRVVYIEDRLHFGIISLWIMVASFASLSVLTAIILFTGPAAITPRDPGSIAAQATILIGSNDLQPLLQDAGHLSDRGIRDKLRNYTFRTSTYRSFRITARYRLRESITSVDEHAVERSGFWKPLAARKPMFVLTYGMPMLAIAALEIMQQSSNRNQGLMTVRTEAWKYLPQYLCALLAVGIATLYNNLDFTIAMFTPFEALRKGNVTARRSILTHLLGKIPPVALWEAVRGHHLGAISSINAAFVASFLVMIVSGLWNIDTSVIQSQRAVASRADTWDMTMQNYSSNAWNAGLVFRLLQYHNLTTPPWTWNELVLPKIHVYPPNTRSEILDRDKDASQNPITYIFTLPSLRPSLNCELLTADDISLKSYHGNGSDPKSNRIITTTSVRPKLPPRCLASLPENVTSIEFNLTNPEVNDPSADGGYIGSLFDLYLLPQDPAHHVHLWERPDNPSGCPSIGIVFGYMRANHTSPANLTVAICNQEIQEIPTEVTFARDPSSGFIDAAHPPKYNDTGPLKLLTNGTDGFSSFSFRVQELLDTRSRSTLKGGKPSTPETYDSIFNDIIYGSHGRVSPESLMGAANANKLFDLVNNYYRNYMAQVINLTLRKPISRSSTLETKPRRQSIDDDDDDDDDVDDGSALTPPQNFTGTLHSTTPRLKLNPGPKLALQLMLAIMIVLGSLAVLRMRLRETLPHNPCSIAGTMSLLAGSELCESGGGGGGGGGGGRLLPAGAERMGDTQLGSMLERQGLLFGLGWWKWKWTDERGEHVSERFGIDVGRAG